MNHKPSPISLNPRSVVTALQRNRVALIGVVLIGLFGYTAYVINAALGVTPVVDSEAPAKIRFDQQAISTVRNLEVVSVPVQSAPTGKADPFNK